MPLISFPDELAAFRARTTDPGFAALIVLGTRQATTAALLLGTLKLDRVAFLLTAESASMPDDIARLLGCDSAAWERRPLKGLSAVEVYEALKALLAQWHDLPRDTIAADVTGGTKPMTVGLAKAAHVLNLPTLYIASDFAPDAQGIPRPMAGSQRLELLPDPYAVFGDLEAAEARRIYAAHDYAGAGRIFADLAARVPAPTGVQYAALAELAALYAAWDVLGFEAARAHADALFAKEPMHVPLLANHIAILAEQQAIVQRLVLVTAAVVQRNDAARSTLADADSMLPLLGTLHAAALRRAAQGRYDFAALFRYRCLELISQHRLATYGLLANEPHFDALGTRKSEANTRFQQQQRDVGRSSARGFGKLRNIGMFDGYMLLAALDDPLVRGYDIKRIEERSAARNQSVLAHGYRLIGREEYQRFAEVVDEIVDRLFTQVLVCPRTDWEMQTRFIDPFATR